MKGWWSIDFVFQAPVNLSRLPDFPGPLHLRGLFMS
jgi:hypothetical protein